MDSLQVTDAQSQAVAVAPRVQLADIQAAIRYSHTFTADATLPNASFPPSISGPLRILTVCLVVMKNGYTVIGKSAPASPENFDRVLGAKFAYEDAVRQLWPLMGYALRDKLAAG